jgi:hypothetical protein
MGNFGSIEIIAIIILFICFMLLPIFAISDILKSKFEGNDAILMVLIVIFVPVAGPILYFSLGPARKIKP